MKKRILSVLLVLVLVVGILPIGVSAENGSVDIIGDPIEIAGVIYYRIYPHQALKMLHDTLPGEEITAQTEIEGMTLHLKSAAVKDHDCIKMPAGGNNLQYWYPAGGIMGVNGVGHANNISSLTIEYNNGNGEKSTTISADSMQCRVLDGDTYSIESNDHEESVVAFYDSSDGNAQSVYNKLHAIKFVTTGESLGHENMPEHPEYGHGAKYVFVNWDKSSTGGDPFLPEDVVNEDTVVYARKTSSSEHGGSEFHVMNTNNAMLGRFIYYYNKAEHTEYQINDIELDSVRIQVNGKGTDHTNPNYWENGWTRADDPYYWVSNYNIVGEHQKISNTHIPFDEAKSITIFATVDKKNATVEIPISDYKGEMNRTQVKDHIVEIRVNEDGEERPEEPDPGPGTTTYTVTFDLNYKGAAGAPGAQTIEADKTATKPGDPVREGYEFDGWYTRADGGELFDFETPITKDITLYAHWSEESAGGEDPADPTEAELNTLIDVYVQCQTVASKHDWTFTSLLDYSYSVTGEGAARTVTINALPYVDALGEKHGVQHKNSGDASAEVKLTYDDSWKIAEGSSDTVTVTFQAKCEYQPIVLVIYRNGDTEKAYKTVTLDTVAVGSEYKLSRLDINSYYKPDKFATGFEFEGWYNDGGWNQYKAGKPNNKLGDSITINGWTNIICMVWDKFPVYYNLVDADGTAARDHTDYVTARDLETYEMYQPKARDGYTFDGWYQTQKDFGNPSKRVGSLYMAKKWELYGTYAANSYDVIYDNNDKGAYNGQWDTKTDADIPYDSTYTILDNMFAGEDLYGWALDGWSLSPEGPVAFRPGEKVAFNNSNFPGLTENGQIKLYAVWAEDKLGGGEDGNEPDGVADYRQVFVKYVAADGNGSVDPRFNTFSLEVDENGKVMTNVALSLEGVATPNGDATFAYWTIDGLGYDGGAYSYKADLSGKDFIGYFAGQTYTFTAHFNGPVVKPEQPNVYEIYVTVHNGTATFCGSEVTSHILAAENEDITITFTPDEGYTLDYATIDDNMLLIPDDGVYTLKLVDSDHTIEVVYAEDKLGGGEDGDAPDQIPDYKQVFVKYVSADSAMGSVEPRFEQFDVNGDIALTGEATANTGYEFVKWTSQDAIGDPDFPVSDSEKIDYTLKMPTGGAVYTFTAHFQVAKPDVPTADDLAAIQNAILVKDSETSPIPHGNQYFGLIDGCYEAAADVTLGEDGQYTFQVTPIAAEYAKQYDAAKGLVAGTHTSTVSQSEVDPVVLLWNPAEQSWSLQTSETIGVKCAAPAAPDLTDLLQVTVKDHASGNVPEGAVDHSNKTFQLLADTYAATEPAVQGTTYVITVQLTDGSAYAAAYDEALTLEEGTHTLTTSVSKLHPITVTYNPADGTWTPSDTSWTLGVKCAPVDPDAGKTLKIYWAIDNPNAAEWEFYDGNARTETIAWSDRNNTFVMPEVVVEEGYHLAGWSVSGARSEYWDADTQTFVLDGLIVEDDEGGYVSITANIVSDEPEDPNAGKTLKIYWAIDNADAARWKLFDNSSWTETIAWSDRGNTFVMPEVVVEEGYHLAGWSVSGTRGEYWDADTQTFDLDGLIVEDDEGGYVSITANIVSDEPEDPNAGKTLKIYWAIDNADAARWKLFDNSSWTETIAWSDRGNTFVMPEVVVEEGYHLAGWSVSGTRGEYWDADTQTFDLDGLIVEDDEGGYVSITANIVSDEPEDPNAGKTLKIYWAIDNADAARWKLFDNSSWTETIAWSDRGNTFVMPEVVVEEGYHLAGWSVSGTRGEYWDADTQTFDLDGLIVEDDEGGYVSITANIVKDVPAAYTVTLVNEGRNAYGEGVYKAGDTVTIYAGTKVGYAFDRWTSGDVRLSRPYNKKITFTMPAHDVVVKATWDRTGSILPSLPDVSDDATPNWLNLDDHDAYIQGYPDGRVKPQNNITRAEVATIFYRLLTDDARDYYYSTDSGFSDVNPGDWYNTAVATMVQAGILNGYSDGTFKPNASITRAEFATIAARFLSNPYSTKDRFYDTEGHWAEVYINRAAEIGWIGGYPDGSFKPDQYITRAEAVTLVNNVLGRAPHADYMLDDMIRWPDNPKSAWYYEDIQEATNSHDYRWSSGNSYEIWTKLLETR